MMDSTLYLFNVSSAHNVEVNATVAQIAEAPQRFFEVRRYILLYAHRSSTNLREGR
jgi:hypothetical protein